ncbi:hypothetical protein DVA86_01170 [Streptomyces armeniacus]|uniref:Protein kinase domain-containing protein n=1 Tax=Streptomyces armeniacus TaxID=83291 RepID=A0A345XIJ4_9ACTN|nr:serine/threonine-protein kinase [Streptomyces armeniacus]AXK31460.1 hypothetical protein DVA86_01170 [Streptomyces armeniacus]
MESLARPRPLHANDPAALGRWRLLARLGSGGMGSVYLARSPGGRTVALKAVHPTLAQEPEFRARFRDEVRATRALIGHAEPGPSTAARHFAAVVDADTEGPRPWLATEYLLAPALQETVDAFGPWQLTAVRALGSALAEALAAVHRAQLVHRDVKPSNVLVTADGPRVIDFGIALSSGARRLTRTGHVLGSPAYMAPEQVERRTSTPYSDVYALAGVLVFAATGRGPFGTGAAEELLYRVVHGQPDLSALDGPADPDGALRRLLARCLAKDVTERPSAAELARLLRPADVDAPPFAALLPAPVLADIAARTTLDWDIAVPRREDAPSPPPGHGTREDDGGAVGPDGAPAHARTPGGPPSRRALLLGAAGTLAAAGAAATGAYAAGRAARPAAKPGPARGSAAASRRPGGAKGTAPQPAWEYRGPLDVYGRPALGRGVLVTGTDTFGELYGIDTRTGTLRWTVTGVAGEQPFTVPDRSIAVFAALGTAGDDRLAFVETANGRTWYSEPLDIILERIDGSPVVATRGHTVFAVGERLREGASAAPGKRELHLFAYDIDRAETVWRRRISPSEVKTATGGVFGSRLLVFETDTLRAYGVQDGAKQWEAPLEGTPPADGITDYSLTDHGMASAGRHGVLTSGPELRLLDPSDGRPLWRLGPGRLKDVDTGRVEPGATAFGTPAVAGNTAYVTVAQKAVLAVDVRTGKRRWLWQAGDEELSPPPAPVTAAGGLVFPSLLGGQTALVALDARTGERAWRIAETDNIADSAQLSWDGERLYAVRGVHIRALPLDG